MDLEASGVLASRVTEEGNNRAICGGEDGLWMAFMIAAVGGKMVFSEERVWRLCARFGRKGNGVAVSNKRAL